MFFAALKTQLIIVFLAAAPPGIAVPTTSSPASRLKTMHVGTNIFLVRHGETEWNKQNRLQGNRDSPLTENGKNQARAVKKSLEGYEIDKAYVSPLKRAVNTLEIILEDREIEVVIAENLREINLGPWEGKTRREIEQSHPEECFAFWETPDLFNLPGAETLQELQQRVVKELDSIFDIEADGNILVVSHWISIKVALAHYSSTHLSQLPNMVDPVNGGFLCLTKQDSDVFIY